MSDPVSCCRARGGVARASELRADGVARSALTQAAASGRLIKPRQGIYAVPDLGGDVGAALAHRGRVACLTAARRHGLWTLDAGADEPLHLWVDPDRHLVEPAADCPALHHRDGPIGDARLWIVPVVHCLVQIARCRGDEAFLAAFESALRQGRIDAADREMLRRHLPASLRWLVDYARADADSGLETLVRYRLHLRGIRVRTQVAIGGVGVVDFVIGDCLILEADGATHDGQKRHADRVRDAAAMALGFVTLRFDSQMILHDWEIVEAAILAALDRGLHRTARSRRPGLAPKHRFRR